MVSTGGVWMVAGIGGLTPAAGRVLVGLALVAFAARGTFAAAPANHFANPSFEAGREGWHLDACGKTEAQFQVDDAGAADGRHSAVLTIGAVEQWGAQFGQSLDACPPGKTYTFAAVLKSMRGPVPVALEIERRARPYDRVARTSPVTLTKDAWTELHVTFSVDKPYPEGWFAYVSCAEPQAEFRVDLVRLYEGDYVPYQQAAHDMAQAAAVKLFDSGRALPAALSGESLVKRAGWTEVPEDGTDHVLRGDAVLVNDRLAVVLRRGAGGAEVYGWGGAVPVRRAVLAPDLDAAEVKLTEVAIVANSPSEAVIDATFRGGDKMAVLRLELAMGQPFVQTEPRQNAAELAVEAPCRFVVLPDFFADDIVFDAVRARAASAELPSESFLLHLLPGGDGLVMTVRNTRDQDTRIELGGQGPDKQVLRSVVPFGNRGKIWVAVLEAAGIWHVQDVAPSDAGKILPLEWTAPFSAQWRVDWQRRDKLASSWEFILQRPQGNFVKYGWFGQPGDLPPDRKRWTTVLGSFPYPCWIDTAGRGHLQPLAKKVVAFEGPAVVYPINRTPATPLDRFTVVDLVRATLGVGPCEYILDVEGQGTTMKGRATCATRDALKAIYSSQEQKQRRAEIERILEEVVIFVKHIRGRIEQYQDFGREMLTYLAGQRSAHPELAGFLDDMAAATKAIPAAYEQRQEKIRTPQYVIDLTDEFRRTLLDYEGDDALALCTRITHAIVEVGGNQDELVGECRLAVRILRQRAALAAADDPRAAEVAKEIRQRTQRVLRNALHYEAPRQ